MLFGHGVPKMHILFNRSRENSRYGEQQTTKRSSLKLWKGRKRQINHCFYVFCQSAKEADTAEEAHLLNMLLKKQLQILDALHGETCYLKKGVH